MYVRNLCIYIIFVCIFCIYVMYVCRLVFVMFSKNYIHVGLCYP